MSRILGSLNIGKRIILGFSLLILLFLFAMITVAVVGIPGTAYKGTFAATRDKTLSDLELASGLLGERILSWFYERRIDIDGLTVSPMLRKALENRKTVAKPVITGELTAFLKSHPNIDSVTIFDPVAGSVLAAAGAFEKAESSVDIGMTPEMFSRLVVPGYLETIDIIQSQDKKAHLQIVRQILSADSSQRIVALLVAEIDLEEALHPLIWSVRNSIFSHDWECVIASKVGPTILQFRVDTSGTRPLSSLLSDIPKSAPISLALAGINGPFEGLDQVGNNVLAYHRQITIDRGTALGLVLKVESKIAFKAAKDDLARQISLWFGLIGAGFLLSVLLARQIVGPVTALAVVAQRIERGDLAARAAENDQTEVGQLAAVFNGMVAKMETAQNELERQVALRTHDLQVLTERQDALLKAVPDIIMEVDSNRFYTWANNAALEFFGDDVVGKKAEYYFVGEQDTYQETESLFEGAERAIYVESRQRRKDGEVRLLAWWCKALVDEQGIVTGTLSTARDITESNQAEEMLRDSEERYRILVKHLSSGVVVHGADTAIIFSNPMASTLLGLSQDQLLGKTAIDPAWCFIHENGAPLAVEEYPVNRVVSTGMSLSSQVLGVNRPDLPDPVWVQCNAYPVAAADGLLQQVVVTFTDITERKRDKEVIEKRLIALTQPLESGAVAFTELFNIDDVQRLQDEFARATGVASIITHPDGTPLTAPSNFTRLCNDIIRKTEKGCAACYNSDAVLGSFNPDGPNVQPCLSGGLWDAGAAISVGGQHIANWLIGQVRNETQSETHMVAYAHEIGVAEATFIEAFREVPSMSRVQFENVARALFTLAKQLSAAAYQNIQQARFINERKQSEEQLLSLTQRLKLATSSARLGVWDWNVRENKMVWDDRMFELYGITRETFPNSIDAWLNGLHPEDREAAIAESQSALNGEKEFDAEFRVLHPDGNVKYIRGRGLVIRGADGSGERMIGINYDITDAKHTEAEKRKLESQLQQAQKMESVGRLAGGVAHDFNNMLSVIMGHAELSLMKLAPDDPLQASLKEISKTAERSADLTRQLLAFARKQTVTPKIIDLNETVTSMLKMLQRLIGENIRLIWQPTPDSCQIKMDPSQIDQILANLCVNARDAIKDTGRITIETGTCSIDADYCATNLEAIPGEYVRLVFSDDGSGMDRETLTHIFEPFYTTKELGKGTGLGLATVYGAVKQNSGFINIYSEPGKGTTFSIHLPHYSENNIRKQADEVAQAVPRGQETILLVEDEAAILDITAIMLEKQGYTVLKADSPGLAMELAREYCGEVHLLMTDVIMPEMNGRDLARNILSLHPGMRRLFMSGYTADIIAHHGVLDEGVHFIQKPFSLPGMATMVRDVLDSN